MLFASLAADEVIFLSNSRFAVLDLWLTSNVTISGLITVRRVSILEQLVNTLPDVGIEYLEKP